MLRRSLVLSVLVFSALSLCSRVALAHKISIFAHAHGNEIHGQVLGEGSTPISGMEVTAYDPAGAVLGKTETDDKGEFSLSVTQRCDWKIVASGDGHQATYTVPTDELPTDLPAGAAAPHNHEHEAEDSHTHSHDDGHTHEEVAGDDEDLHRQVIALRRDIDELRNELRWQDIIGGVGYILGLMGVAFYFLGSRRSERFPSKSSD